MNCSRFTDLVNVNAFTSGSARTGGSGAPTTARTCGGFVGLGLLLVSEPPVRLRNLHRGTNRRFQLQGPAGDRTLLAERSQLLFQGREQAWQAQAPSTRV